MDSYSAPLRDMRFILDKLVNLEQIAALPGYEDADPDLVYSILEEADKFAGGVLAPLNKVGDTQGCRLENGQVILPDGWKEAWTQFAESGWIGLSLPPELGGQGLPKSVWAPVWEMYYAANIGFTMGPYLNIGQTEALEAAADEALKARFLAPIVSGEWACTMCLTEPQAGSDLSVVRTRAEPAGDGSYRLSGQKVYISYGDHELTENIVHLVLARLPDAPEGIKGISLFLVPKYLVNEDGSLGTRNDIKAVSLEHKMGMHGSPTCTMVLGDDGGATGYLVGELNRGIQTMFIMMNDARFSVAVQGPGLGERAYQMALAYARERVQGRCAVTGKTGQPILQHPDVRRQLLDMRTRIFAMRTLVYTSAAWFDQARHHPDEAVAAKARRYIDLLMPVLKGWNTETGNGVCDDAIQVFGGMGFVEETGVAQHYRDSRVTRIYEGTTGIQANDLVGRKVLREDAVTLRELINELRQTAQQSAAVNALAPWAAGLADGVDQLECATNHLMAWGKEGFADVLAAAVPFLHLSGIVVASWRMLQAGEAARAALAAGEAQTDYLEGVISLVDFWFATYAPQAAAHARTVLAAGCVAKAGEGAFLS
ncbi:MAG: acyl-CoA dehydrogenase [Zoogloea sp.]|uniref:acyl-CoA dehydrogenase n=1 Tax=Zoogloea sp. TaxID=49181 RepID=UPI003F36138C